MARWNCQLITLVGAGYFAYGRVGTGFLPRMDEGSLVIDYHTAPGTSLTETNRELLEIEAILKNDPYVASFSRRTGRALAATSQKAIRVTLSSAWSIHPGDRRFGR